MISRVIKVEVRVISRSRRLRLITLTETLIILDITKTKCNNCFIIHWTKKRNVATVNIHLQTWLLFCFFTDGKPHKVRSLRLRLITLYETVIILNITKPNLIIVLLYIERKKKCCNSKHSPANLDIVLILHRRQATQRAQTWHDYPWKSCTTFIHDMITHDLDMITPDLDMIIVLSAGMTSQALIPKINCTLSANQKRDSDFNV